MATRKALPILAAVSVRGLGSLVSAAWYEESNPVSVPEKGLHVGC